MPIYFLPYKGMHAMAVLPTYWSFRSLEKAITGTEQQFYLFLAAGFIFQSVIILFLSKRLAKSVSA